VARRSKTVEIGFVSFVAAAALAGCNEGQAYHRDWQQCVDSNNVVVEDRLCDPEQQHSGSHYYHWLYSPRPYYPGGTVIGGYTTPRPNIQVAHASSASPAEISRGGFGSSAHGSGGGE
jgi:hypothetical protein